MNYTLSTVSGSVQYYNSNLVAQIVLSVSLYWQIVVSAPAVLLNFIVFVTYVRVKVLPASAQVILTNQSLLEMCSAAFAILWQLTSTQKPNIPGGVLGEILCNVWTDAYWSVAYAMQINSVTVTADRFFAVCFPLRRILTRRRALALVVVLDLFAIFSDSLQNALTTYYDQASGYCLHSAVNRSFILAWGVFKMIAFNLTPFISIALFYPPMIYTIVKSRSKLNTTSQSDKVHNAATNRLVRTCFIATLALAVSNIPNIAFYYILYCILGQVNIAFGSYEEAINTMCTSLYPLLAPIIFSFSIPKFRDAAVLAFFCKS